MVKRCTKCILPETIPHITFDENGACRHCTEYIPKHDALAQNKAERARILDESIDEARRRRIQNSSQYDVLVPLSGGRDSSYTAWALSVKKGLKVLCVNYDNPFSSIQARRNVDLLVKKLDLDLVTFKWPNNRHEKSFGNNLRAWLKVPDLGSMGLFCLACKPMYLQFYRIARMNRIGLIIDGSNPNEVTEFKLEAREGVGSKSSSLAKSALKMGRRVMGNYRYWHPCNLVPGIHTLMSLDGDTPYLRWKYPDVAKNGYFWCYPYNESEINRTLEDLRWEKAKDNKSPWRFDCEIDSLKNYIYQRLVGATEKEDMFSKSIRAGLMTREEAVGRLEEANVNIDIVERVLERVGMRLSDLDRIKRTVA